MARMKNPLPGLTDGEVLRAAAVLYTQLAQVTGEPGAQRTRRAMAARLRMIARRVPRWPDLVGRAA